MKEDSERGRKRMPGLSEIKDQAALLIKRAGVYYRGPRRIDLFGALVSEMETHFQIKEATGDAMLQKIDCNALRENAF